MYVLLGRKYVQYYIKYVLPGVCYCELYLFVMK